MNDYFHRVRRLTATQFYINNATRAQAELALKVGATGCTNNPSFTWKILSDAVESQYCLPLLDQAIEDHSQNDAAQSALQSALVKDIASLFYPIWKQTHGAQGYVSIQGDPVREHDADVILSEGRRNREIAPNVCIKIPATEAGLIAMEALLREDTPINATEIMSVAQGVSVCDLYERVTRETGSRPPLFLSFIAGILNEYLRKEAKDKGIDIERDALLQAGTAALRKMHRLIRERALPITMISGGVRENVDFTDFVGGNIAITMNWLGAGSATAILESDLHVVSLIDAPIAENVLDMLREKLPDFTRCYDANALSVQEYETFGPVELFRNNFLAAWENANQFIQERRESKR